MSAQDVPQLTTEELLQTDGSGLDTDCLRFVGQRGHPAWHLDRQQLVNALAHLAPAPPDAGRLELLVARGPDGQRSTPKEALLTAEGGMPGDRWVDSEYGPDFQLAATRSDVARLIANGQPLELHGDNLYLHLDLSSENVPEGSLLRMGEALLCVTPQAHNGCKKWVQRFGLAAMKLNLDPDYRDQHLRGIYLQVVKNGRVRVGDTVHVVRRGVATTFA